MAPETIDPSASATRGSATELTGSVTIDLLPPAWDVVAVRDVAESFSGGTPPKSEPAYWGGSVPWLSPKDMKALYLHDATDHIREDAATRFSRVMPAKTIFVVVRGMILAKDLPVAISTRAMAFNQDMKALRPNGRVDPEYLLYAIISQKGAMTKEIGTSAHGTRRIGSASLDNLRLPLPPLPEQRRIAAVLSDLQTAVTLEEQRLGKLKQLKAAAMAKVYCEGLRGEQLKQTEVGPVPRSWSVVPLGDVLLASQYGLSLRGEKTGPVPILRMNCQQDGRVVFRDLQFVAVDQKTLLVYRLDDGDLLFNRTNSFDLVGRTALFAGTREVVFASYLVRLRVNRTKACPAFLNHYLNLETVQRSLKTLATRGVSQSNISASKLRTAFVPVPALDEQTEIATMIDTMGEAVECTQRRLAIRRRLFSSTLQQLMSGKLSTAPLLEQQPNSHA